MQAIKSICCIGAGHVGGPTMAVIAQKNPEINVTVFDINEKQTRDWNINNLEKLPVYEPGVANVVSEVHYKNLHFSTDVEKAIEESEMIFISENTHTKTYGAGKGLAADLKFVELCVKQIARVAKEDKIVIEKSTLPDRTAESIKRILEAKAIGKEE